MNPKLARGWSAAAHGKGCGKGVSWEDTTENGSADVATAQPGEEEHRRSTRRSPERRSIRGEPRRRNPGRRSIRDEPGAGTQGGGAYAMNQDDLYERGLNVRRDVLGSEESNPASPRR